MIEDKNDLNNILDEYIKLSLNDSKSKSIKELNNNISLNNDRDILMNFINDDDNLEIYNNNLLKNEEEPNKPKEDMSDSSNEEISNNKKSSLFTKYENQKETIFEIFSILKGNLKKKRKYLKILSWRDCLCVLENNIFKYYYSDQLKGFFDFNILKFELNSIDHKGILILCPFGINHKFFFKIDINNFDIWKTNLLYSIKEGSKKHKSFCKLVYIKKFWKYKIINEEILLKNCDIGDLILFNTKNIKNLLFRTKNNCDFDHLAIILRNKDNDVVLLESNTKLGTIFTSWNDFIQKKLYKTYNKIAYRKFLLPKNEEYYNKCEEFVNEVIKTPPKNSNFLALKFFQKFNLLNDIQIKNINIQEFLNRKKNKNNFLNNEELINLFN